MLLFLLCSWNHGNAELQEFCIQSLTQHTMVAAVENEVKA